MKNENILIGVFVFAIILYIFSSDSSNDRPRRFQHSAVHDNEIQVPTHQYARTTGNQNESDITMECPGGWYWWWCGRPPCVESTDTNNDDVALELVANSTGGSIPSESNFRYCST